MSEEDEAHYGLVMPFVVTKSNGGSLDDTAFVVGVQYQALATKLDAALAFSMEMPSEWVNPILVPQLDLLAMHKNVRLTKPEPDYEVDEAVLAEWVLVKFERIPLFDDEEDLP